MTPTIVHINPRRARFLGLLCGALTLLMGLPLVAVFLSIGHFELPIVLGLILVVIFAALAVFSLGLARRRPVALRMDERGISGYYVEPALWRDIADIGLWSQPKAGRFIGFSLKDPKLFFDQQSPWRRFVTWANGRNAGYHLIIAESILKDADVAELVRIAQTFHAAAQANSPTRM